MTTQSTGPDAPRDTPVRDEPQTARAQAIFRHRDRTGHWIVTYEDILAIEAEAQRLTVERLDKVLGEAVGWGANDMMERGLHRAELPWVVAALAHPEEEQR